VVAAAENGGAPRRSVKYELTPAGGDLLQVSRLLERWLIASPGLGRPFGEVRAKAAVRALTEGWSATLLRALAVGPLSIADLDSVIKDLNYPSLERRIAAMRLAGQVEALPVSGRETPYAVTGWLRRGVAPLLAAMRWERRHLAEGSTPIAALDVEAIFLLAMPLLDGLGTLSGSCRLAVEVPSGPQRRFSGALVKLDGGELSSCSSRLDGEADAWASGSMAAWFRALIERDVASLEVGGDGRLVGSLIAGLHRALFVAERAPVEDRLSAVGLRG
jgi:DNA-binding HxlR family transcriptional regulator